MRLPFFLDLQNIPSPSGDLHIFEDKGFNIKRVFVLSNLKNSTSRGYHAHKLTDQVLVCLKGKIIVHTETPNGILQEFSLDSPQKGLFIPAEIWHYMTYLPDTIQMVLASELYNEDDYLRVKEEYLKFYQDERY